MADILFDMPMDEATNSLIAYDYSIYANHGEVTNAIFVPGHDGNAAHFTGTGYIRTGNPIQDLSLDFTLVFWLKSLVVPEYSPAENLLFQFAFSDNSIVEWMTPGIVLNQWQSVVLVKYATGAKIYIDGVLLHTMVFTAGHPVEWAIKQHTDGNGFPYTLPMTFGAASGPYAVADIDNVLVFNEALDPGQIDDVLNPERRMFYEIDGIPFTDFDVYVKESSGIMGSLELKETTTVDWAGEHGLNVDLERPRYKPREIELNCFIYGGNYLSFTMKVDSFLKKFQSAGTHRLRIGIDKRKPLLYEVYLPNATDIDKRWRDDGNVGTFKLKLVDPQPIRRVLRFVPTAQNGGVAKIRFTCYEAVNIYWGDGTNMKDVIADADLMVSHTFTTGKPFYEVMITGEPDNISNFSHNCLLVWTRL